MGFVSLLPHSWCAFLHYCSCATSTLNEGFLLHLICAHFYFFESTLVMHALESCSHLGVFCIMWSLHPCNAWKKTVKTEEKEFSLSSSTVFCLVKKLLWLCGHVMWHVVNYAAQCQQKVLKVMNICRFEIKWFLHSYNRPVRVRHPLCSAHSHRESLTHGGIAYLIICLDLDGLSWARTCRRAYNAESCHRRLCYPEHRKMATSASQPKHIQRVSALYCWPKIKPNIA